MTDENIIEAVAESANFGPYYEGETFVTVTFRIPKDAKIHPGRWCLRWMDNDMPAWSKAKDEIKYARARERDGN